jgi:hypothetical protein
MSVEEKPRLISSSIATALDKAREHLVDVLNGPIGNTYARTGIQAALIHLTEVTAAAEEVPAWRLIEPVPKDREWSSELTFDQREGPAVAYADDDRTPLFFVWWTYLGAGTSETTHWTPLSRPAPPRIEDVLRHA